MQVSVCAESMTTRWRVAPSPELSGKIGVQHALIGTQSQPVPRLRNDLAHIKAAIQTIRLRPTGHPSKIA